ncbi:two-component system, OmpR family, response regulator [Bradyrhizobium sp. NFR13]|uniref:response regulator n=1 Tax=Bradyrhizobium sp. NFR13 TaxID=1566285 RepID=UPI0008ECFF59|nr:response regulator [Bradyrhizobium sp. NFR13]SFL59238.1 two-component system, OmpR family, response regulator [Bradyrhizobium sp. NFR13]
MQTMSHILIVDDDLAIRKLLGRYLTEQGYRVSIASDQRTMKEALQTNEVSLIVLDVLLPDGSGLDICRDLRREGSEIPVILLTALKEDVDRIIGLEIGADDYLGKPFNPRELLARIRAVLRRKVTQDIQLSQVLEHHFGRFKLHPGARKLLDENGHPFDLTTAEFELLLVLVRRPGRLLSRDQLIELTNRGSDDVFDRSIDVLMSRLRKKLGDNDDFHLIKTVRNGGYIFSARVETIGTDT